MAALALRLDDFPENEFWPIISHVYPPSDFRRLCARVIVPNLVCIASLNALYIVICLQRNYPLAKPRMVLG